MSFHESYIVDLDQFLAFRVERLERLGTRSIGTCRRDESLLFSARTGIEQSCDASWTNRNERNLSFGFRFLPVRIHSTHSNKQINSARC